jgi:hypothetical protein
MKTLKTYRNFLDEGILDQIFGGETSQELSKDLIPKEKEVATQQLIDSLAKKIGDAESSPVYVFNQSDSIQDIYISVELFNEAKRLGFQLEKQGTLYTNSGRYSYSVLDCSFMQNFDIEGIKSGLYNILKKNEAGGIKTIIEFANISSLLKDQISNICDVISSRQVLNHSLKIGDFFILSDNSSNHKGGKDISDLIPSLFPKVPVDKFKHSFLSPAKDRS